MICVRVMYSANARTRGNHGNTYERHNKGNLPSSLHRTAEDNSSHLLNEVELNCVSDLFLQITEAVETRLVVSHT